MTEEQGQETMTAAERQLADGYTAALSLISDRSTANVHRVLNILRCRDLLRKQRRLQTDDRTVIPTSA
jgi:hypothetical protein